MYGSKPIDKDTVLTGGTKIGYYFSSDGYIITNVDLTYDEKLAETIDDSIYDVTPNTDDCVTKVKINNIDIKIGKQLSEEQKKKMIKLVKDYEDHTVAL